MDLLHSLATRTASLIDVSPLPQTTNTSTDTIIPIILSIVFGIVGALALLFITISGLRYITSAGDPQKIAQAKEGIIYALVGLTIAISAEAIVVFFISKVA